MRSIIVHVSGEDPVVCEVEDLPQPADLTITVHNPRKRDGMDLHYLDEDVTSMIIPWHRVNFVQILPSAEAEDIIGFVRE